MRWCHNCYEMDTDEPRLPPEKSGKNLSTVDGPTIEPGPNSSTGDDPDVGRDPKTTDRNEALTGNNAITGENAGTHMSNYVKDFKSCRDYRRSESLTRTGNNAATESNLAAPLGMTTGDDVRTRLGSAAPGRTEVDSTRVGDFVRRESKRNNRPRSKSWVPLETRVKPLE